MIDLETSLKLISDKVKAHAASMATEEAVKTAVVLPFLRALGYDVFDPFEVIPEFTADAVGKKGEKVDYAIHIGGDIRILIECKPISTILEKKHLDQLFRYFTVTNAKFAILTNGKVFQFYTDLDEPNKLDTRPFLTFDITDLQSGSVVELKKFEKAAFDVSNILATAERLKYTSGVKQVLLALIENPSEDFVKLIAPQVYDGRLTAQIKDMLLGVTRSAFREVLMDEVKTRLTTALAGAEQPTLESSAPIEVEPELETTEEEKDAFLILRAIAREVIDPKRVVLKDAKSYCAILIDNNNRRPLARLHFNSKVRSVGLFDGDIEEKIVIDDIDQIYAFADRIKATAQRYAPAS